MEIGKPQREIVIEPIKVDEPAPKEQPVAPEPVEPRVPAGV